MLACFVAAGASTAVRSEDAQEAEELFRARWLAYPAVERLGDVLTEDVCVPVASLSAMVDRVEAAARRHDVMIATLAHAGDGNLHPLLVTPRGDEAARARVGRAFDEIIDAALELGGTIAGEHGVGLLKIDALERELAGPVLELHHLVKAVFDPAGILNPGKLVPVSSRRPA